VKTFVRRAQSDNGIEFKNTQFEEFLDDASKMV
jgi:hypothetical protein